MEEISAFLLLAFVGLSQQSFSDQTACVGDKSADFNIGSPDDPLKVRFECLGSAITKCILNGVKVNEGKDKWITMPTGGQYQLRCDDRLSPGLTENFGLRICKGEKKTTVDATDSDEKVEVSFECDKKNKQITKCIPKGESKGFSSKDIGQVSFGGLSGRKFLMTCWDTKPPVIREDYSGERCFKKAKFIESVTVSASIDKIDVEISCGADGKVSECRPDGGEPVKPLNDVTWKKGTITYQITCFETIKPTIKAYA